MAGTTLYTRSGDSGQTTLGAGRRVPKTNGTLEVLGNIDELISQIAVTRSSLPQEETDLTGTLKALQNDAEGRTILSISHRLYETSGGRTVTIPALDDKGNQDNE